MRKKSKPSKDDPFGLISQEIPITYFMAKIRLRSSCNELDSLVNKYYNQEMPKVTKKESMIVNDAFSR